MDQETAISVDKLTKPKLLLLDVYETLLDMTPIERMINDLLDSRRAYQFWLERLTQYCFVDNCIDRFNPFREIAKATLQMTAHEFGEKLSPQRCEEIIELLRSLPVKAGVQDGLSKLNDQGFRLAALTNSPHDIVADRMNRTGLISYFEKVMSAEHVEKYKPCCVVYQWALGQVQVKPHEAMIITSHAWDMAGAMNAGMTAAFIGSSKSLYDLAPKPQLLAKDLDELVGKITILFGK